jgi:hypothetical protein
MGWRGSMSRSINSHWMLSRRSLKVAMLGIIDSECLSLCSMMRFCTPLQVDSICCMSEALISSALMKTCSTWRWKKEAGFELH